MKTTDKPDPHDPRIIRGHAEYTDRDEPGPLIPDWAIRATITLGGLLSILAAIALFAAGIVGFLAALHTLIGPTP